MTAERDGPAESPGPPQVVPLDPRRGAPSWRLISTLGAAGAIAGLLIVFVYRSTQPAIEAHKARQLQLAIQEVLHAPEWFDTLYLLEGVLTSRLPEGADPRDLDRVYQGFRGGGQPLGFAIAAGEPGFQDVVELIFGYDLSKGEVLGMKVLESKETPGLGDKIEKDRAFVDQFQGAATPLEGVKPRGGSSTDPHAIDMISGATISSRTVIRIINNAVNHWRPALEAYVREESP